ncbi:MAG: SpoIVB peptidase [Clostridium sp.]|nr:SpoIVB peptidase [Clostridium sp.]
MKIMKRVVRAIDIVFAVILTFIYTAVGIGSYSLPAAIHSNADKQIVYNHIYSVKKSSAALVDYQSSQRVSNIDGEINLFGIIPVKKTEISNKDLGSVYVSGESFGIKLYTDGVIVVGTKDVDADAGRSNPAKEAGIEKGDVIVEINNTKVTSSSQVEEIFNSNNGTSYRIKVKRNNNYKNFTLEPVYSKTEGCYKVGIWVRDSTAGIGTITFYNPKNNSMAALGHPITDVDTNEIMPILNGEAVKAPVTKIYKSSGGETGSICCDFSNDVIASLTTNNISGIYGKYSCAIDESRLYQVAPSQEVERGQAQILCTLDDRGPQLYTVEITRVSYKDNEEKNMVVRVTDSDLLEKTGGIVQGMSGSPIIQNGKLVGALTHVIVDNPEKGYGIFAEKMVSLSESVK